MPISPKEAFKRAFYQIINNKAAISQAFFQRQAVYLTVPYSKREGKYKKEVKHPLSLPALETYGLFNETGEINQKVKKQYGIHVDKTALAAPGNNIYEKLVFEAAAFFAQKAIANTDDVTDEVLEEIKNKFFEKYNGKLKLNKPLETSPSVETNFVLNNDLAIWPPFNNAYVANNLNKENALSWLVRLKQEKFSELVLIGNDNPLFFNTNGELVVRQENEVYFLKTRLLESQGRFLRYEIDWGNNQKITINYLLTKEDLPVTLTKTKKKYLHDITQQGKTVFFSDVVQLPNINKEDKVEEKILSQKERDKTILKQWLSSDEDLPLSELVRRVLKKILPTEKGYNDHQALYSLILRNTKALLDEKNLEMADNLVNAYDQIINPTITGTYDKAKKDQVFLYVVKVGFSFLKKKETVLQNDFLLNVEKRLRAILTSLEEELNTQLDNRQDGIVLHRQAISALGLSRLQQQVMSLKEIFTLLPSSESKEEIKQRIELLEAKMAFGLDKTKSLNTLCKKFGKVLNEQTSQTLTSLEKQIYKGHKALFSAALGIETNSPLNTEEKNGQLIISWDSESLYSDSAVQALAKKAGKIRERLNDTESSIEQFHKVIDKVQAQALKKVEENESKFADADNCNESVKTVLDEYKKVIEEALSNTKLSETVKALYAISRYVDSENTIMALATHFKPLHTKLDNLIAQLKDAINVCNEQAEKEVKAKAIVATLPKLKEVILSKYRLPKSTKQDPLPESKEAFIFPFTENEKVKAAMTRAEQDAETTVAAYAQRPVQKYEKKIPKEPDEKHEKPKPIDTQEKPENDANLYPTNHERVVNYFNGTTSYLPFTYNEKAELNNKVSFKSLVKKVSLSDFLSRVERLVHGPENLAFKGLGAPEVLQVIKERETIKAINKGEFGTGKEEEVAPAKKIPWIHPEKRAIEILNAFFKEGSDLRSTFERLPAKYKMQIKQAALVADEALLGESEYKWQKAMHKALRAAIEKQNNQYGENITFLNESIIGFITSGLENYDDLPDELKKDLKRRTQKFLLNGLKKIDDLITKAKKKQNSRGSKKEWDKTNETFQKYLLIYKGYQKTMGSSLLAFAFAKREKMLSLSLSEVKMSNKQFTIPAEINKAMVQDFIATFNKCNAVNLEDIPQHVDYKTRLAVDVDEAFQSLTLVLQQAYSTLPVTELASIDSPTKLIEQLDSLSVEKLSANQIQQLVDFVSYLKPFVYYKAYKEALDNDKAVDLSVLGTLDAVGKKFTQAEAKQFLVQMKIYLLAYDYGNKVKLSRFKCDTKKVPRRVNALLAIIDEALNKGEGADFVQAKRAILDKGKEKNSFWTSKKTKTLFAIFHKDNAAIALAKQSAEDKTETITYQSPKLSEEEKAENEKKHRELIDDLTSGTGEDDAPSPFTNENMDGEGTADEGKPSIEKSGCHAIVTRSQSLSDVRKATRNETMSFIPRAASCASVSFFKMQRGKNSDPVQPLDSSVACKIAVLGNGT